MRAIIPTINLLKSYNLAESAQPGTRARSERETKRPQNISQFFIVDNAVKIFITTRKLPYILKEFVILHKISVFDFSGSRYAV